LELLAQGDDELTGDFSGNGLLGELGLGSPSELPQEFSLRPKGRGFGENPLRGLCSKSIAKLTVKYQVQIVCFSSELIL